MSGGNRRNSGMQFHFFSFSSWQVALFLGCPWSLMVSIGRFTCHWWFAMICSVCQPVKGLARTSWALHRLEKFSGQKLTTVTMTQPRNASNVGSRGITWFAVHIVYKMELMSWKWLKAAGVTDEEMTLSEVSSLGLNHIRKSFKSMPVSINCQMRLLMISFPG